MADLAKTEIRGTSIPQATFRRDTTEPRVSTDRPRREVNARIERTDGSNNAEALAKLLGVAADTANRALTDDQARRDGRDTADAALDFSANAKNDSRFARSRAYRDSWQLEGSKKLAIDIGDLATQAVNERLNDSDNPATIEDIDGTIEGVFKAHVFDKDGKLLDFGTTEAKTVLARSMQQVRAGLLPQAMATIKKQTDERVLGTMVSNKVYEFYRGAPMGEEVKPSQVDALAPLPDPDTTKPYYAPVTPAAKVAEPFAGFAKAKPSSIMGAKREGGSSHNGEDFPIPSGTQLVSPMAGEVIASFSNDRGGNQVRVKLADGAIVGYAHLSSRDVKVGDKVDGGQLLGLSGATGHATGPHVHMTVEQGGKKVSPRAYFASAKVPSGLPQGPAYMPSRDDPQLTPVNAAPVAASAAPFDFEGAMRAVPPGIDKKQAKDFILQAVVNTANEKGDVSILSGLETSTRKDGTPSLSPDDVAKLQSAREQISEKVRIKSEKARKDLWDKNADNILLAFESDTPPSIGFLRKAAHDGLIDPNFGYSMENHLVSEQKADAREARAEERSIRAEANQAFDMETAGLIALRQSGDTSEASAEGDLGLYNSGKLGTGKQALMRYRQLRAAQRAGEQENLRNPEVGQYAGFLKMRFGVKGAQTFLEKSLAGKDQVNFTGMMTFYRSAVGKGTPPAQAYTDTILKFAPNAPDAAGIARRRQIEALRARRLAEGR